MTNYNASSTVRRTILVLARRSPHRGVRAIRLIRIPLIVHRTIQTRKTTTVNNSGVANFIEQMILSFYISNMQILKNFFSFLIHITQTIRVYGKVKKKKRNVVKHAGTKSELYFNARYVCTTISLQIYRMPVGTAKTAPTSRSKSSFFVHLILILLRLRGVSFSVYPLYSKVLSSGFTCVQCAHGEYIGSRFYSRGALSSATAQRSTAAGKRLAGASERTNARATCSRAQRAHRRIRSVVGWCPTLGVIPTRLSRCPARNS